jgi:hypothetical protein
MILKQNEINKAALNNDKSIDRIDGFKSGAKWAESKFEDLAVEFGEYLMKLNNSIIRKETNLKPLDSFTGPKLVKDMFQQFIKERNG